MIERYTNPEMGHLWSLQHEFEVMLEVEITACEAMAELGQIPKEAAVNIRQKAQFNLDRVHEIEKVTNHDIIAFLTNVAEYVGEDSKYIHKGLTSSDVKDTALGIMMRNSADIILDDLHKFRDVLKRRAAEFKHTPAANPRHHPRRVAYMLAKIDEHQSHIAQVYGITKAQARWLLATVAFHGIAVADTVYSVTGQPVEEAQRLAEEIEMEAELDRGMRALIVGALVLMDEEEFQAKP